jgi:hypothetical protein
MNAVTHETTWECSADKCGAREKQTRLESVFAALDSRFNQPHPCPPYNWTVVEGRVFCPRHDVEVTARVRTPSVIRLAGGFISGLDEEVIQLRHAVASAETEDKLSKLLRSLP